MPEVIFSQVLPFKLTNGNDGRSKVWYKSANNRKKFEKKLRQLGLVREPFDQPVSVHVTRILGKGERLWDSSSGLRGCWKEMEDSLVAVGWFVDDSPKYIAETRFFQDVTRRAEGSAVLIEVVIL